LNEGLSVYAEQVAGYGLPAADSFAFSVINSYFSDTACSPLTVWDSSYGYGSGYLFVLYLAEQYGAAAIRLLETSAYVETENVERATAAGFDNIFNKWIAANYLDGLISEEAGNAGYYYSSVNLRGTYDLGGAYGERTLTGPAYTEVSSYPYQSSSTAFMGWAPSYVVFAPPPSPSTEVTLFINGDASSYISGEALYGNIY
jgi:hypothetical protein